MKRCKESEEIIPLAESIPDDHREKDISSQLAKSSCLISVGCFARLTCWNSAQTPETLETPGVLPKAVIAKAKAKPPPPPPKARARAKGLTKQSSCPARDWRGPKPTEDLKAQRVVDWNPIRQEGLLEGSVWQQVNHTIGQRSIHLLAPEALNQAFMRPVTKSGQQRPLANEKSTLSRRIPPRKRAEKDTHRRILQPKQAFMADVLYQQLAKRGLTNFKLLRGVIGEQSPSALHQQSMEAATFLEVIRQMSMSSMSSSEDDDSDTSSSSGSSDTSGNSSDEEEEESYEQEVVDVEALRILLDYLRFADSVEEGPKAQSGECSAAPLAKSEDFLQQLVAKGGSPASLRAKVQAAMTMSRFPKEVDELEKSICLCIQAIKTVLDSTAIPVLLEGVLLLGNYVNSSSALGSAGGVTLESLAKLAHTRVNASFADTRGQASKSTLKDTKKEGQNAICLLVRELQESQGTAWLHTLLSELEDCRTACGTLTATMTSMKELQTQVSVVEKCVSLDDRAAASSVQARCRRFMAYSTSRLATLRALEKDLVSMTAEMRTYFAEAPHTNLTTMLHSLASLLDVLPKADAIVGKQM